MKRLKNSIAIIGLSLAATACGSTGPMSNEGALIIGAATMESGFGAQFDEPALNAVKLAIADINAAGGLNGQQVTLRTGDTQTDAARGKAVADKLLREGANMLIAPCDYGLGASAAIEANKAKVVTFSLCATDSKWGPIGIGPHAFTPNASSTSEGVALAKFARSAHGWQKAAVVYEPTISADITTCESFKDRFEKLGGEVVRTMKPRSSDNVATTASQIAGSHADVVVVCMFPPSGPSLLRQIRAQGVSTPVLASTAMDGEFWHSTVPQLGEYFQETYADIVKAPSKEVAEFLERYTQEYGTPPPNAYALNGYVLMQVYAEAVKRAGSHDERQILEVLQTGQRFETLLGEVSYSETSHVVEGREFQFVEYNTKSE